MSKPMENNQAVVCGQIVSGFSFNHETFGEKFYLTYINLERLSTVCDVLPVMVSERLVDTTQNLTGKMVNITGQFRSYNRHDEQGSHLMLSILAKDINLIDDLAVDVRNNFIYLEGYICKEPVYRETPLGRELTEILLAVNRSYGKADYIPCICWGKNAVKGSSFNVSDKCALKGRIQSRKYIKRLSNDKEEERIAYEVSVVSLEMLDKHIDLYGMEEKNGK